MNKKVFVFGTIMLVALIATGFFVVQARPKARVQSELSQAISVSGIIENFDFDTKIITLTASSSRSVAILLSEKTILYNETGKAFDSELLEPGQEIIAIGALVHSTLLDAANVFVSENKKYLPVQPDNVFKDSSIPSSYSITGLAENKWFAGKGYFTVIVRDSKGTFLSQSHAYLQHYASTTNLQPFTSWLAFDVPATATGSIIFQKNGATSTNDISVISIRFADYKPKVPTKIKQ